jgi:hypothetical protein
MQKDQINIIHEEKCDFVDEEDLKDDYSREKQDNSACEEIENKYNELNNETYKENSNSKDLNHTLEEKPESPNNNAEEKQEEAKNVCKINPVKKINFNSPQKPAQNNQQSPQKENLANSGQNEENLEDLINYMNNDSNTDNKKDFEYPFQNTEKNVSKKKTILLSEYKLNKKNNNNQQQLDTKINNNDKQTTYKIKEEIKTENQNVTINEPMNNMSEVNNLENNLIDYNNILPTNRGDPNENDKNNELISELKTGKPANITIYNEISLPIDNELASIMGDLYNDNFYPESKDYYFSNNYYVISNNVKEVRVPNVSLGITLLEENNNSTECVEEKPNG